MKKFKKTIVCLTAATLAVVNSIGVMPYNPVSITAFSAETDELDGPDNLSWTYDDEGTLIISGEGAINERGPWCSDESIKTIIIENGITTIRTYAFAAMTEVTEIILPDTLTTIENWAFTGFPKLTSLKIPASVTHISEEFIGYDFQLDTITVDKNNEYYTDVDGVLFDKEMKTLITYPTGKSDKEYIIPNGVEKICNYAFYENQKLESVEFSDSIMDIGDWAFYSCVKLSEVVLNDDIKNIGIDAFNDCENLKKINLPDGLLTIGDGAFARCESLSPSMIIPDTVTSIGKWAFSGCVGLISVKLPAGLSVIKKGLFNGCECLSSITIPDSVTAIEDEAFRYCHELSSVVVPIGVESIGDNAFYNCSHLIRVEIKNPDCVIFDSETTFTRTTTLCGLRNSTAEKYARKYERKYEDTTPPEIVESGNCGIDFKNLKWTLDAEGVLTIAPPIKPCQKDEGRKEIYQGRKTQEC